MEKKEQRIIIKKKASELSPAYCLYSDRKILEKLVNMVEFQRSSFVFCYISTENEVNTKPIIEWAWSMGKRIAVPKCISKGVMEIYEISSYDDLEPGAYNIPEPKKGCSLVAPSEIDFSIIPCVSCDRKGRRLGHGGGYYDRYLESTNFITAAVCRENLLLDVVSTEPHDKNVNYVITETAIYPISETTACP